MSYSITISDTNSYTINLASVSYSVNLSQVGQQGATGPAGALQTDTVTGDLYVTGDLGVGTTSPQAKIHINSTVTEKLRLESGSGVGGGFISWYDNLGNRKTYLGTANNDLDDFRIWQEANSSMRFATNGTEAMRIDSSGNVGIGATSPSATLHVDGTGLFSGDVTVSAAPFTSGNVFDGTADSDAVLLDNSNYIAVQRTNAPNLWLSKATGYTNGSLAAFAVNGTTVGTISTNGTTTGYNTTSDYRLKDDISPVMNASERVLSLNPVNFEWISSGQRTDGFIAHELQEVIPDAVTGEKDAVDEDGNPEYQGIDQSKLVPLLTAALQDALKRIDALEKQIGAE